MLLDNNSTLFMVSLVMANRGIRQSFRVVCTLFDHYNFKFRSTFFLFSFNRNVFSCG